MEREISYKREMNHNYLMIKSQWELENSYEAKMMLVNSVDGLLRFSIKRIDNKCYFCYEITSKQPLGRLLENKSLQVPEIRRIVQGIARALSGMEEYLLKERQILLKPEFIYVEPDSFQVSLCLVPGEDEDFPKRLSSLLEYLLGHVDYQDKDGVIMAYGLYRESLKENYGMDDLLGMLSIKSDKEDGPLEQKVPVEQREMPMYEERVSPKKTVSPKKKEKKRFPVVWLLCLPGSLVVLWLLTGKAGLERFGLILAVGEVCIIAFRQMIRNRKKPDFKAEEPEEKPAWQMVFAEDMGEHKPVEPVLKKLTPKTAETFSMPETGGDTVLLVDKGENKALRRLESMEPKASDILVSYYPFIIGKQENLVDYMFCGDTVSRLHLRLDESEGRYRITDLNSTNGTTINGRILEANETAELKPGDEVDIADYRFRFV